MTAADPTPPGHPVARYHPVLVVLHWLLALLLLVSLSLGMLALSTTPNTAPEKIGALKGHMIIGGLILLLMLGRLAARLLTAHPPPARTGMAWADRVAPLMHWALYLAVFAMVGSGIGISIGAGLPGIVFGGLGSLPADFSHLPARVAHGLIAKVLLALIALHVAAALFHQLVRKDGLLSRMGLGRR